MKTRRFHPFAALAALAATTAAATAAPGALDSTFGVGGKATANFGNMETASAIALAPGGKIVLAGNTTVMGSVDIAVVRYNANGTLDTSFSGDGGVVTDFGTGSLDNVTCVTTQPDGKILVGGYTDAVSGVGFSDFMVLRYNVDGSLDTFFGVAGKVTFNQSNNEQARAIKVQADGKIALACTTYIGASPDFGILRLKPDGAPDTSFSSDGFTFFALGTVDKDDVATSFAIQPDGKYVVAGYTNTEGNNDFAVLRVKTDGSRDLTFDGNGETITSFGGEDRANAVTLQPDGKIIAAGTWDGGAADFALARYKPDGTPDTTFSGDGRANASFAPTGFGVSEGAYSIALQPDGRIVLAGYTLQTDPSADFGVMRFTPDGLLDPSFDTDGKVTTSFAPSVTELCNAAILQPDGRLLVAGISNSDFAVARYNMTARADTRVGTNNKTTAGNNVYNTTGAGQSLDLAVRKSGGKKVSYVSIQNDGDSNDSFTVLASPSDKNFTIRYYQGSTDVTTKVTGGYLSTGNLAPGASFLIKVEVTAKTKKANAKATISLTGKSATDASAKDTVLIKAKSN